MRRVAPPALALLLTACFSSSAAEDDATTNAEDSSDGSEGSTDGDTDTSDTDTSDTDTSTSDTDTSTTDETSTTTEGGCPDPICFEPAVELGAGFGPEDVIVADVDGDGELDIVTANAGGDNVGVLRGLGGGDFEAPVFHAAGVDPVAVAALNLDPESPEDGGLDLVVGNRAGQSMSVLLNTGGAVTYGAPDIEMIGVGLVDLDVGNTTFDTNYESVVGAVGELGILLSYGTGLGIAGDLDVLPTTDPAVAVAAGFLTQDAYSDFISVSDQGATLTVGLLTPDPPDVQVFDLAIASSGNDLVLASLNPDPQPDLVVASANLELITVFAGEGNGMFGNPSPISIDVGPDSLAVGDVDDDGKVDVIYAASAANEVGVMLGTGSATLALPLSFDVGQRPLAVAVAEFNGDGKLDIVTANADGDNVSILLSTDMP